MSELYSYPSNDYRSYLAHHGVKGMKWGVRKPVDKKRRRSRLLKTGLVGGAIAGYTVGKHKIFTPSIKRVPTARGVVTEVYDPWDFSTGYLSVIAGATAGLIAASSVDKIVNTIETSNGKKILNKIERDRR